ncbi:MAG: glycosyltransferase [Coriobacteriia bacterium]|nr:glycosyltransferase [Coriobacteriia bacterium]
MRLLLITYEFPPKGGVGVQRPLNMARYLAEAGWDVTVLTVADPPASVRDETPLANLPASVRVERAWSLEPTRLMQALRRARARSDTGTQSATGGARGYSGMSGGFIRFVQAFFIPDEKFWWTPWAVSHGRKLHREAPFDVILASGPPFTALGIGRRLSRALRIPWVADLRDPIVGGYFFRPHTPLHAQLMRAYERRVVAHASRVITATDGMRNALAVRSPDAAERLHAVTNGFDPVDFAGPPPEPSAGFTVAYVGTFQGSITADTLLAAVARAREADSDFARDVRVRLVGPLDPGTGAAIERHDLASVVDRTGFVPHHEAVAEMCVATLLVVILGPEPESADILTGKLPEYLASGRPVLALVPEGEAAALVRRARAGWVVPPDDVDAAARALRDAHAAWRADTLPEPDPEVVAEYDRRVLVKNVSSILEQVIADAR